MQHDIWGVFHDGSVIRIDGAVPGTLRLEIDIQYLRRMFPEPGDCFIVTLSDCTKFTFTEYDGPPITDHARIQALEPEILYVNELEPLILDCDGGTLELDYQEMSVSLESGYPVGYDDLVSAADKYWAAFAARAKRGAAPADDGTPSN
jgi:hypothetical protein